MSRPKFCFLAQVTQPVQKAKESTDIFFVLMTESTSTTICHYLYRFDSYMPRLQQRVHMTFLTHK